MRWITAFRLVGLRADVPFVILKIGTHNFEVDHLVSLVFLALLDHLQIGLESVLELPSRHSRVVLPALIRIHRVGFVLVLVLQNESLVKVLSLIHERVQYLLPVVRRRELILTNIFINIH